MAKLLDPLYGDSATGGIAGVLYYRDGGDYQTLTKRPHRISRKSVRQILQRQKFKSCCESWLALSISEQMSWDENRGDLPSGFSAFMQNCLSS